MFLGEKIFTKLEVFLLKERLLLKLELENDLPLKERPLVFLEKTARLKGLLWVEATPGLGSF